ncbi:hypothetical protein GCM10014715_32060 [Streptomyces spiralis]|uniref:Uncharacterized protein n=1 Tax=Streptomyces spiralis TaxID=66376 RepID=A0A919DT51_9ACTN|nr:hypothetical protein GCM10014715_32060 [Streptomyces spiralis]
MSAGRAAGRASAGCAAGSAGVDKGVPPEDLRDRRPGLDGRAVRLRDLPAGFRPVGGAPWGEAGKSGDSRPPGMADANYLCGPGRFRSPQGGVSPIMPGSRRLAPLPDPA